MTWDGGPPEEPAARSGGDAADAGAPAQPHPDVTPRQVRPGETPPQVRPGETPPQVRPGETPPPPPSATSGRGRAAGDSATRKLPADVFAGVPCATCPPPRLHPEASYDGALIGAGCVPYSGRGRAADIAQQAAVREGRIPGDAVARVDPETGGGAGGVGAAAGSRAAASRAGASRSAAAPPPNLPTPAEMREAFAHPVLPEGPCCQQRLAEDARAGRPSRTILYVNGIMTHLDGGHCCSLRNIASTTCARVVGVYNAIGSVPFVSDLWQSKGDIAVERAAKAGRDARGDVGRNPALDAMQAVVVQKGREGEPLEIWAHSQGGALTSAALLRAKEQLRRDGVARPLENVTVNSYGSAAVEWPDGPTYTHHIHSADPVPAHLTGSHVGRALDRTFGDAGLGLGPVGERRAGRGATMVYADGAVPESDYEVGTYTISEHRLPDPAWRRPAVASERMSFEYHYFDSSYLPLYRERARAAGRRDGCQPSAYPYGDPCGPRKPRRSPPAVVADHTAVAAAERARGRDTSREPAAAKPLAAPAPGATRDRR